MQKLRIVTIGMSGGRSLTGAVSRRPPISLVMMVLGVTRTPLGFGICPSFKGHSLSRRPKPVGYDSQLLHRCRCSAAS
jgi:hypothetical protein